MHLNLFAIFLMNINVGLIFSGSPVIKKLDINEEQALRGEYSIPDNIPLNKVENLLIGQSFHWESEINGIFPGEIHLSDNSQFTVNTLPLEIYLKCVVGSEMNPSAPAEFLKCHSIVSRSWAVGKILGFHRHDNEGKISNNDEIITWDDTGDHSGFDVCSDDHCQRYQGLQKISAEAAEAIDSTSGMVLVDGNDQIIDARFSKCCGGQTELFSSCWQQSEPSSLRSFPDPWCDLSSMKDNERRKLLDSILKDYDRQTEGGYRWSSSITRSEVATNLKTKFNRDIGKILSLEPIEIGPSGRIIRLRINGEKGSLILGKELAIRRLLSRNHLYSSAFEITTTPDSFFLSGKGWGHGVGMCQIGAAHSAAKGHTAEEILSFYYPGATIKKLY